MKADSQVAHEWFDKGDHDLSDAILLFRHGGFADSVCYHCHQAVEKYLKGYLLLHTEFFIKIHDLPVLLDKCVETNPTMLTLLDEIKFLNQFYIESKYPMDPPVMPSRQEAKRAVEMAETIIKFIHAAI